MALLPPSVIRVLTALGDFVSFAANFFGAVFKKPFEGKEFVNQLDEVGSKSLLLTGVTGLAIGIVLAMQSRAP